jgi:hypothetical protein
MTERSLQVTYRKGRAFAAYLHLSHPTGEKTARTVPSPDGLLVVDCQGCVDGTRELTFGSLPFVAVYEDHSEEVRCPEFSTAPGDGSPVKSQSTP